MGSAPCRVRSAPPCHHDTQRCGAHWSHAGDRQGMSERRVSWTRTCCSWRTSSSLGSGRGLGGLVPRAAAGGAAWRRAEGARHLASHRKGELPPGDGLGRHGRGAGAVAGALVHPTQGGDRPGRGESGCLRRAYSFDAASVSACVDIASTAAASMPVPCNTVTCTNVGPTCTSPTPAWLSPPAIVPLATTE